MGIIQQHAICVVAANFRQAWLWFRGLAIGPSGDHSSVSRLDAVVYTRVSARGSEKTTACVFAIAKLSRRRASLFQVIDRNDAVNSALDDILTCDAINR